MVKNLLASARVSGDTGLIPELGRTPGGGNTPVFLPGESHGQRSLVGYSPQDCKELGVTEGLSKLCLNTVATTHMWLRRI